jgi:hypothetical protein
MPAILQVPTQNNQRENVPECGAAIPGGV